jgi:hypothetical protein
VRILNLVLYRLYYINVCPFIEDASTAQVIQHCTGNERIIINKNLEKYIGGELHQFPAKTEENHDLRFKLRTPRYPVLYETHIKWCKHNAMA